MNEMAITMHDLTCEFRRLRAVDTVNLQIPRGRIHAILAPNRSGKTTLLRLLLGEYRPNAGQVRVLEQPAGHRETRRRIGYADEQASYPGRHTPRGRLIRRGKAIGLRGGDLDTAVSTALNSFAIHDMGDERIGLLSRGAIQRLALAEAFMGEPQLVLLDEPCAYLDPQGRGALRVQLTQAVQRGATVLICSSQLTDIAQMCDDATLMRNGRVICTGAVTDLLAYSNMVDIEVEGLTDGAMSALRDIALKLKMYGMPPARITAYLNSPDDLGRISHAVVANGATLLALTPKRETLDELYERVMGTTD